MSLINDPVATVYGPSIFARSLPEGRQVIVYQVSFDLAQGMAIILPIPVKPNSGDKAVQFVDLSGYPEMLEHMDNAFPKDNAVDGCSFRPAGAPFESVYVPSIEGLARLEEKYRPPEGVWKNLPAYRDFGFVVFKFSVERLDVYPLAFAFPRKNPAQLYFPTMVVVCDDVPATRKYGGLLYCQKIPGDGFSTRDWRESPELPARSVDVVRAKGVVDPRLHLHRREMKAHEPNKDTVLG
jgi:hypothetical protein